MDKFDSIKKAEHSTLDKQVMRLAMLFGIPAIIQSAIKLARQNGVKITLDADLTEMGVDLADDDPDDEPIM